jgi:hypothetical protein
MVYRKGELSKAMINRDWPHQVALPAYRCMGHEYLTIHISCQAEELLLGELLHPATQPRWPGIPSQPSALLAEDRLRNGRCFNCDD